MAKPVLTNRQRRYLFAVGVLRATGKGKKRKVSVNKEAIAKLKSHRVWRKAPTEFSQATPVKVSLQVIKEHSGKTFASELYKASSKDRYISIADYKKMRKEILARPEMKLRPKPSMAEITAHRVKLQKAGQYELYGWAKRRTNVLGGRVSKEAYKDLMN